MYLHIHMHYIHVYSCNIYIYIYIYIIPGYNVFNLDTKNVRYVCLDHIKAILHILDFHLSSTSDYKFHFVLSI